MNFEEHKKQIMSKWTWYQRFSYWVELKLSIIWFELKMWFKGTK